MTGTRWAALVIAVGFIIRLCGIGYGLPFPLVSDEELLIGGALRMLELRTLLPVLHGDALNILYYPPFLSYVYIVCMAPVVVGLYIFHAFPPLDQLGTIVLNHLDLVWLAARLVSVAFGTATLYLTYRIAEMITGSRIAAVAAAAVLSVDFMHAMLSHVARHWSATVFFIWLSALLALKYAQHPSVRLAIAGGLAAALGFGTSYIGVLGVGFAVVAHLYSWRQHKVALLGQQALAALATCFVASAAFVAVHPYPFFRLLKGTVVPIYQEKTLGGWLATCDFYLDALWKSDPLLLVGVLVGAIACVATRRSRLLTGAIVASLAYLAFLYKALPIEDRYILPLTPLLAILCGYGFSWAIGMAAQRPLAKLTVSVVGACLLAYPAMVTTWTSLMLQRPDTRELAKSWLETRLAANERVLVNMNTVRLNPDHQSLLAQRSIDGQSLKTMDRLRLAGRSRSEPADARPTLNLWQLSPEGLKAHNNPLAAESLLAAGYSHYVFDSFGAGQIPEFHSAISAQMLKIAEFSPCKSEIIPPMLRTTILVPYSMDRLLDCERFGPVVTILRVANR
jgi:hypothetical protein